MQSSRRSGDSGERTQLMGGRRGSTHSQEGNNKVWQDSNTKQKRMKDNTLIEGHLLKRLLSA